MTEAIRAFFALELPEELRRRLHREQERLRRELPRARWVRPEGVHVTLKFLGETSREVLDGIARELAPGLSGLGPAELRFTGTGFFPSPSRARVAWIGGEESGACEIAERIDRIAVRHGFEGERRPWALHVTLARLDRPWPEPARELFLRWGEGLDLPPLACREAVLFASRLGPGGAVYTALERFPLE